MTKTFPKLVPTETKPPYTFDGKKQEKIIKVFRKKLMNAAVKYVIEGATDNWGNRIQSRLKAASDFSGIPIVLIEAEMKQRR
jgi:hypothetical protein